jgi:quercetin dioxygenase-like cupin family protein
MELGEPVPTGKAPAELFTGDAWLDLIHAGRQPSRMRVSLMRFSPGARTVWHRHLLGATLHVVSGVAVIGTRDGTIIEAHPGETVSCPPGEEHWHGATPDRFMEHLTMWEAPGDGSPETEWFEPVAEAQYHGPRINTR